MSMQIDLNSGAFTKWMNKVDRFMFNSNMNNSAIGREGLEVYDGGWIRILNGGLQVIGSATVSGTLDVTGVATVSGTLDVTGTFNASGDNNMTGTNNLSGTNHLTGPTDVAGNFEIIDGGQFKAGESVILPDGSADFGEFHIAPDGTLNAGLFELRPDGSADFGDLHIDASGKVTSGQFELNPDGSAKFGMTTVDTEGRITSGNVQIDPSGSGLIRFDSAQLQSLASGDFAIVAPGGNIDLMGLVRVVGGSFTILGAPPAPAGAEANVYMDGNGQLCRI